MALQSTCNGAMYHDARAALGRPNALEGVRRRLRNFRHGLSVLPLWRRFFELFYKGLVSLVAIVVQPTAVWPHVSPLGHANWNRLKKEHPRISEFFGLQRAAPYPITTALRWPARELYHINPPTTFIAWPLNTTFSSWWTSCLGRSLGIDTRRENPTEYVVYTIPPDSHVF